MTKKIRVLVVPSDRTGVGYFRSTKPHIALEEYYSDEFHVDIDYEPKLDDDEWIKQYDIIHYHRTLGDYEGTAARVKHYRDLGVKTIMDIDDYWSPGQHHPAYHLIKNNKLDEKIIANIKSADMVTTTTPVFADEIRLYNKNVFVLPNAIDPNEKQYQSNPEKSDRIRIGWLGGSSHLKDLEILNNLVNRLQSDGLMDKLQFVLCGFDLRGVVTMIDQKTGKQTQRKIQPMESVWYKYEQIFTNDYKTVSKEYKEHLLRFTKKEYENVDNESYRRVWTKPISSYAKNYNLFDISLAPLEDNKFNRMKSQLKVIESGFHKKALIAQGIAPYEIDLINAVEKGGNINSGGNALIVDTKKNHKSWYTYIKKLVENPELISVLGDNLYNTVSESYSIRKVTEKRRNFYKKILK